MHLATLRAVGGSVMFSIPKALLESLNLAPEMQVGLSVAGGRLIVDPYPRRRYTLAELVALCDAAASPSAEDTDWLDDGQAGREAL